MRTALILALLFSCLCLPASAQYNADPAEAKAKGAELERNFLKVTESTSVHAIPWNKICADFDNFERAYGLTEATKGEVVRLRLKQMRRARGFRDRKLYFDLLTQLKSNPIEAISAPAEKYLAAYQFNEDLKTKPIELKFTDVNGQDVDLAKMRGKVVLLHFWTSRAVVSYGTEISDLYKNYRDKGFEIVGISADTDKEKMLAKMAKNDMTWPQYFSPEKGENELFAKFENDLYPRYMLFDKQGMLVSKTHHITLFEPDLAKLLATP